jgi:hypothetical protein
MTCRFIHTSDWHIAKPFGHLPAALAGELTAARFAIVGRIADAARTHGVGRVVVAGDTFDADNLPTVELRRTLAALAAASHVTWDVLPGNHDPARAGGLFDRLLRLGDLPPNLRLLLKPEPVSFGPGAVLLPAPLTTKSPGSDPTAWMDSAPSPAGTLRIGLAHGSVQGFGSAGESAVTISPGRAKSAGLDYLALGDWHGMKSITASTWYSGTPEPDRFLGNDPGHVLLVEAGAMAPPVVTPMHIAQYCWLERAQQITTLADLGPVETDVCATAGLNPLQHALVVLKLSGHLSVQDHIALDRWVEHLSGRLRFLHVDRDRLAVRPDAADYQRLAGGGLVAEVLRDLQRIADDPSNPRSKVAERAMLRLIGFVAEVDREGAR